MMTVTQNMCRQYVQNGPKTQTPKKFKFGDIQNIRFIPDEELNISVYGMPIYVITYKSNKLPKTIHFWPILYKNNTSTHSTQLKSSNNKTASYELLT